MAAESGEFVMDASVVPGRGLRGNAQDQPTHACWDSRPIGPGEAAWREQARKSGDDSSVSPGIRGRAVRREQ